MLADLKMPGALEASDAILAEADGGSIPVTEAIEKLLGAQIYLRNNRRHHTAHRLQFGTQQVFCVTVLGIAQNIILRTDLHDFLFVHDGNAIADVPLSGDIQCRDGFVAHHQFLTRRHRPDDNKPPGNNEQTEECGEPGAVNHEAPSVSAVIIGSENRIG